MSGEGARRVVFEGPMRARLEDVALPESLSSSGAIVRSEVSLISPGTELALFSGTHIGFKDPEITWARYPINPGYATVGIVEKVGSAGGGGSLPSVGDRILHYKPHADLVALDAAKDFWLPLPQAVKSTDALFLRFGQIASTAVEASRAQGDALVLGAGIVGNLCAQLLRERARRPVLIADLSSERLGLAERCGLRATIDSSRAPLAEAVGAATQSRGVNTIVEATGVPALVPEALRAVNRGGEVILLGSTRGTVDLDVYKLVHRKATSLVGAHETRYPERAPAGAPSHESFARDVLERILSGSVVVSPFVTDTVGPEDFESAYRMLLDDAAHHVGVVVVWSKR